MTRSDIFLGKTLAGLGLYALAAGLPPVCSLIYAAIPGHVAAPFEWGMALPATGHFLAGTVYYFAGMLTGLRQARWYVSRGLGLGLALLVSFGVKMNEEFGWSLLLMLIGAAVLGTAAWGGFQNSGHYEGQPGPAKGALTLVMTTGAGLAAFALLGLVALLFSMNSFSWSYYSMGRNGTIYKVTTLSGKPPEIVDLEGKPLRDEKTGRMMDLEEFNRRAAPTYDMDVDLGDRRRSRQVFLPTSDFFSLWRATPDTLWYFWRRYGRVVGYDIKSRQLIGSLGPKGFEPKVAGGADHFEGPAGYYWNFTSILKTADAVYYVDAETRTVTASFTAPAGERIGAAMSTPKRRGVEGSYLVVATRQFIRLLDQDGRQLWRAPYEPGYPDYAEVRLSLLEPKGQFAVWIGPSPEANEKAKGKLPTRVLWLSEAQGISRSTDLAALPQSVGNDRFGDLAFALAPPGLVFAIPLVAKVSWHEVTDKGPVLAGAVAAGLLCAAAGWWLGRRYNLSRRARTGWAVFHLVSGVPGLLGFLCVQEWPAREVCPSCKKLRVVNREHCEHCGTGFSPPQKSGIEIFEPAGAAATPAGGTLG